MLKTSYILKDEAGRYLVNIAMTNKRDENGIVIISDIDLKNKLYVKYMEDQTYIETPYGDIMVDEVFITSTGKTKMDLLFREEGLMSAWIRPCSDEIEEKLDTCDYVFGIDAVFEDIKDIEFETRLDVLCRRIIEFNGLTVEFLN